MVKNCQKSLIFVLMTIENYIQDLLYRYECVIIPEFGALITQRTSAEIEAQTHTFFPPQKSISFNRQLKKNDGLLANHIAEVERVSYEAALQKTHDFVREMNSELFAEKEVRLGAIGSLFMEEDDKLIFEPSRKENFLLDAFGMDCFTTPKILREVYKEETQSLEEKTGLLITAGAKSSKQNYLRYAAVAMLAIGLSGLVGLNWYNNRVETHNLAAQKTAENQLENKIQQATFVIGQSLPEVTLGVEVQPGKYHIVAGAFREEANAVQKTKQLRSEGFHARRIGQNKYGLHQVVYGSYQNQRDAVNALHKIQRTDNESAWLLVEDLQ